MRVINRRAKRDYQILRRYEAGIVLTGGEVKSVKEGRIRLEESFIRIRGNEAFLVNAEIPFYRPAGRRDYDSRRERKLLLHKREILDLGLKTGRSSLTIVPLACYTKRGLVKVEIALVRGKKKWEKREAIKRRDLVREMERELREKR